MLFSNTGVNEPFKEYKLEDKKILQLLRIQNLQNWQYVSTCTLSTNWRGLCRTYNHDQQVNNTYKVQFMRRKEGRKKHVFCVSTK